MTERLYRVHHRGSVYRGRVVRLLTRPSGGRKHGPRNVLAEDVETSERFVCPFRGLRRLKGAANGLERGCEGDG